MRSDAANDRAGASDAVLAETVRAEAGRIVGALARFFGSIDVAEEAVAEAVEEALGAWRRAGVPPGAAAWLTIAARRNALDRMRRAKLHRDRLPLLAPMPDAVPPAGQGGEADDRLPLLFGCCHPALSPEAKLALTLRAVLGVTTAQIAQATQEPAATVGQRISRAKRKMAASGIRLRIPEGAERASRLDLVLTVISVMYDTAHHRPGADARADRDLAEDALWLASVVAEELPGEAEAHGLRALLLFHRARDRARSQGGEFVPLPQQDRRLWDRSLIAAAHSSLERAAALRRPGRWQLQAAIAACHSDAAEAADTDWPRCSPSTICCCATTPRRSCG
ncbi:RNA polymerase sigma factor [Microbacterium sp. NIBRBAC000506063]|uniref:RNA polymerase sigma factor n=1 Tax=Microbacterium sp. NIBRBAC000506063 TaxID=2734618 RepID=UPI001CB712AB|nr:DUF6596 domain-containing protein [Microbacterium sp. NIBRBAC000506063]